MLDTSYRTATPQSPQIERDGDDVASWENEWIDIGGEG